MIDDLEVVDFQDFNSFVDEYKEEVLEYLLDNYSHFKEKVEDYTDYVKQVLNSLERVKNESVNLRRTYNEVRGVYTIYSVVNGERDEFLEKWKEDNSIFIKKRLDTLWYI